MNREKLLDLTNKLLAGELALEAFIALLQPHTADLDEVTLDLDRARRCGFPEVVYAEGKSVQTIRKIFTRLVSEGFPVLATRMSSDKAEPLLREFVNSHYNELARTFRIDCGQFEKRQDLSPGHVLVITAGTSDLPVAEEARETLDWMGVKAEMIHDVGVAGPQRLLQHLGRLRLADAVVVVAGMEGALPSVVGGHVACPVIAVPTSVGYGAAFAGVAALLGMLNSCAANVAVVNIDAGFKAGYLAGMIARRAAV